jgi:hypothetical protein
MDVLGNRKTGGKYKRAARLLLSAGARAKLFAKA